MKSGEKVQRIKVKMAASLLAQSEFQCQKCPECTICMGILTENPPIVAVVPRGHIFHQNCFLQAMKSEESPFADFYRFQGIEGPPNYGTCANCRE